MNRIFGSVYVDEDVHILVAELLRSKGFHSITARDAGMLHQSDDSQLEFAARNGMAILTHDYMDFLNLHTRYLEAGSSHSGIILARRFPMSPYWIADKVEELLNQLTADELDNQLFHI